MVEQPYDNTDGSPIDFTKDFLGDRRSESVIPGTHKLVVWKA